VIAGGAEIEDTDPNTQNTVLLQSSYPSGNGWIAVARVGPHNLGGGTTLTVTAYAICAS
jgi:hypothetical protein